jgi:hypothetical protein
MANVASCTQYGNYGPRKIHASGIKISAYDWTLHGIKYANGRTYIGDGNALQPAPYAISTNTPNCRSCHAGC